MDKETRGQVVFGDLCSTRTCCHGDEKAPQVQKGGLGAGVGGAEPPPSMLVIVCLFPSGRQQKHTGGFYLQ